MTTTQARCLRCGHLTGHCHCPDGPLLPPPPEPAAATGQPPELMTPAEIAALLRAGPTTVTRWAQQGKLRSVRTLGGHRRYPAAGIHALLNQGRQCAATGHGSGR